MRISYFSIVDNDYKTNYYGAHYSIFSERALAFGEIGATEHLRATSGESQPSQRGVERGCMDGYGGLSLVRKKSYCSKTKHESQFIELKQRGGGSGQDYAVETRDLLSVDVKKVNSEGQYHAQKYQLSSQRKTIQANLIRKVYQFFA